MARRPLTARQRQQRGQRAVSHHRRQGDSDLTVLEKTVTALRAGYDPDATNYAFDGALWLLGRLDKRETRLKPTLRRKRAATKGARRR